MRKAAILQSNYIPWKGVFDMINSVDVFVFLDDVDFTKRDWRTRNRIKTPHDNSWLSVPVVKSPRGTKINEISIVENDWQKKHFQSIKLNYQRSPFFKDYLPLVEQIYLEKQWSSLSEMNQFITILIANKLDIKTEFIDSKELNSTGTKDDKLLEICHKANATHYLSGPAAKDYIDIEKFKRTNIGLEYILYDYKEYKQLFGDFNHYVSVLDVLFNCGPQAQQYIFNMQSEIAYSPA